jgi:alkanesulfonate monooxygenase SsuD/methylene tetrahydromethanopterin reductase-like flavin-dependent oxidoreductase (luciferase family)
MEFGVFDHLDRDSQPLHAYFQSRLDFVAALDRAGFHGYHVAEHHSTPLGMAPSPSVYLAAVAQRTRTMRFGPMIFALPLYHPLRLAEEICMLDQMSGGRLDMGFGRGASPIELRLFGEDPTNAEAKYAEALDLILKALTEKTLSYRGRFFDFSDVPIVMEPYQKPYPPVWYGVHSPDSAARAARRGLNIISLDNAAVTRTFVDSYRAAWRETRGARPEPRIGISYFVVIDEDGEAARRAARRAYPVWHRSFNHLFNVFGTAPRHPRPAEFDAIAADGKAVAGTPQQVRDYLRAAVAESGVNYLVVQIAFGDLTPAEIARSVELFARDVMPALRG